jgi:hypothetical protein
LPGTIIPCFFITDSFLFFKPGKIYFSVDFLSLLYYINILKKWRREIYFPPVPSPQAFIFPGEVDRGWASGR